MPSFTEITTAPTFEPLDLNELKNYLRMESSETHDDDELRELISVARNFVEGRTNRAFLTQTRTLRMPYFPTSRCFYIDGYPVQSITSITYTDTGGSSQTFDSSKYQLIKGPPDRVELVYVESWPTNRSYRDLIEVVYVCGDTDQSSVDVRVKQAMKIYCQMEFDELSDKQVLAKQTALDSLIHQLELGDDWVTYGTE